MTIKRRQLGLRSNVSIPPELKQRLDSVAEEFAKQWGGKLSISALCARTISLGLTVLEQRLGLPTVEDVDDVPPKRHVRGARGTE